jgi:hypothetical protein
MPVTYSINVGQIIEATRKPNIFTVLQDLPDNTQKLISPRDVRDAFLSVWANSSFKLTNAGINTIDEYIGIDSGNPNDRDIKKKILLGKRSLGNVDVMDSNLLSSDTDIFFYNTKPDSADQSSTKIGFLSGTNSALFDYAPYIESLSTTSSRIDFNIHNPSIGGGPISLYSTDGRVSINGILFPTIAETVASASTGKILRYYGTFPNGVLKWDESFTSLTQIGSPGFTTSIYGSPVLLNNYPLEFVDDGFVPTTIGGITQGSTFQADSFTAGGFTTPGSGQNWPLSEILRKMLYPYIEPVLELSVINETTGTNIAESGVPATLNFSYSLTTYARTPSEYISEHGFWEIDSFGGQSFITSFGPFQDIPGQVYQNSFGYSIISQDAIDYVLAVSTVNPAPPIGGWPFGFSFSATQSIKFVNPIYFGYETISITNSVPQGTTELAQLFTTATKLIIEDPGTSSSVKIAVPSANQPGYLYFAHPSSFVGDVLTIKDPNGFVIHDVNSPLSSAFGNTYSIILSPLPYANTTSYKLWKLQTISSYSGGAEFEFIF